MTERTDWEHVANVRRMVIELPPEVREHCARLNRRHSALSAAVAELRGEQVIASEHYREVVAEALEELREEIGATFQMWRAEQGIPEL